MIIVTLFSLYLLQSNRFITGVRIGEFLGIFALLILFELLNLLLKPILGRITHHSPLLMVLGMLLIAFILVPLHQKIEKWSITRLVAKNKCIRLATVKRTIEKLDKN